MTFPARVWSYKDFDNYIKKKTVVKQGGKPDEYPITLEFDETTFRVTIDLTTNNFHELIGFEK